MPTIDPLDEFSSESATGQSPAPRAIDVPPATSPTAANPSANAAARVSLEEILRREVVVDWDEAVAVVEEVCALLAPTETGVPDASDLFITDGAVVQRHGARAQSDSASAGRLLHALLSTASNTPVPLRLFVTQASGNGAYANIAAFASALAYFGKAGRSERIRTLYLRCATPDVSSPAAVRSAHPKREDPPAETLPPVRPRRSVAGWALASLAAIGLAGAAVLVWSMRSSMAGDMRLPSLVAQAREAVSRLASSNPAEPPVPAPEPAAPASKRRAETDGRMAGQPTEAPHLASRSIGSPSAPRQARTRARPNPTLPSLIQPPASAELSARSAEETAREAVLNTIYSGKDVDVEPPVLLHPQIPANLMLAGESRLNVMELLVSEEGTVEQVRLIAGPSRLPDVMLLSGAKAWRFKPASRDGEAVRYRALVSWAGTP